ncbi:MAG: Histidine kinase [uncultured bacterium]|nr:MAG: Histidine kinase [uncultured bacterium]
MKAVIVDDDFILSQVLMNSLIDNLHAEVKNFYNGDNLVSFVEDFRPNIILLDIMLPNRQQNGLVLLNQLKLNAYTKRIPVIMMTGINNVDIWNKALKLGASDYLLKPFDVSDFINTIQKYCPNRLAS